jgi:hypothetical protein
MTKMRAKMRLVEISRSQTTISEGLMFRVVPLDQSYPPDGSDENNSFAKWTPSAELKMVITNPELVGTFTIGEEYYLDFTKA